MTGHAVVEESLAWTPAGGLAPRVDSGGGRLLVADSWLVREGRVRALERHRERFLRACGECSGPPLRRLLEFWRDATAALPRTGEWFPRVELAGGVTGVAAAAAARPAAGAGRPGLGGGPAGPADHAAPQGARPGRPGPGAPSGVRGGCDGGGAGRTVGRGAGGGDRQRPVVGGRCAVSAPAPAAGAVRGDGRPDPGTGPPARGPGRPPRAGAEPSWTAGRCGW